MTEVADWITLHYDEIIGTLISFIYLYFSIRQNILLWPLGLISSAIYVYIFLKAGIYADMGLQVYYVIISIYGWYSWISIQKDSKESLSVKSVIKNRKTVIGLISATFLLMIILSQLLIYFTDSTIPYLDAFTTALSITATWMLAKKYIEQWLVWIIVDSVSAGLYFYKGLYITIVLYIIYSVLAYVGYKAWIIDLKKQAVI